VKLGGKEVMIGITSDEMARKRVRCVLPYELRAENVRQFILRMYGFEPEIVMISDPYGKHSKTTSKLW